MTGGPLKRWALVAIIIGNMLEWYDFAVYGYFVSSIAKLFFPNTDHVAGLLAAFGVFGLGFVGRVGGSLLYGLISDRKGRGYALRAAVILMAVATTAIGCLPTYQTIGRLAPILLIGLRLCQGLSLGGEFATSLTLLAEYTMPGRRGFASGWVGGTGALGFLLGSSIGALLTTFLSSAQLESWGWRLPFWAGSVLGITAWIVRQQLAEAQFLAVHSRKKVWSILSTLIIGEKLRMLRTFLGCALYMVGFYVPFVYLVTGLEKVNLPLNAALFAVSGALLILAIFNPLAGLLADRIGVRRLLILSGSVFAMVSMPLFQWMQTGGTWSVSLGLGVLAILFAPVHAVGTLPFVLQFAPEIRGTAFSISLNVAAIAFGGLAPVIADVVVRRTGLLSSCGTLLLAAASLSLWAWTSAKSKDPASGGPVASSTRVLS